jgi:hypothetical protein
LTADGAIINFFLAAAADSDLFGHQLIWALNSEARPPEEAFNPEVKRYRAAAVQFASSVRSPALCRLVLSWKEGWKEG